LRLADQPILDTAATHRIIVVAVCLSDPMLGQIALVILNAGSCCADVPVFALHHGTWATFAAFFIAALLIDNRRLPDCFRSILVGLFIACFAIQSAV
jgi:hypothetical protein